MKRCSRCKKTKEKSEFSKHSKTKDGLYCQCKECTLEIKRTFKGFLHSVYSKQKTKSIERKHDKPSYTKEELENYLMNSPKFAKLFNDWAISGYQSKKRPSIDRLDDFKGYSFDNIQIITWEENMKKTKLKQKGILHGNTKSIIYYETFPIERAGFKARCKVQNLKFEDFVEIKSHDFREKGRNQKYFYFEKKGSGSIDYKTEVMR